MEKMSILMGKLGQQKVASGPGQKKKLVLFGWVCLHEHPPFWQFILPFFPSHAGVLRRTTPYVCNAFQWLWNLSTNLCLFLKFQRSVKKGPPSLNQARTELICYPAISLGLNSDILSILLVYGFVMWSWIMTLSVNLWKVNRNFSNGVDEVKHTGYLPTNLRLTSGTLRRMSLKYHCQLLTNCWNNMSGNRR